MIGTAKRNDCASRDSTKQHLHCPKRPVPAPLLRPAACMLQIIAFTMASPLQAPKQKHKNDHD
jgi:hypothetical protein